MLFSGVITAVVGLGLAFLLRDSAAAPVGVIAVAAGVGITLRGLAALASGEGPGKKLIYWGWGLVFAGLILAVLLPLVGLPLALLGGIAVTAGSVVRARQSGTV